jgi:putative Holliday junction resolvase
MNHIGIDYGTKWLGLAWVSDELNVVVPLKALRVHSKEQVINGLHHVIAEKGCDAFVIGLPIHCDGTEGMRVREVKSFANLLKQNFNLPVFFQDERFSTQVARTLIGTDNLSLRRSKTQKENGIIDSSAAAVILEDWIAKNKQ